MKKNLLLTEHLAIASGVLVVLLSIIFLSFSLIQNVLTNPSRYFETKLSGVELQIVVTHISLVVIMVLVSFLIYLLLTLRTRAEIMVLNVTKSLSESLDQFTKLYEEAPVPYIILNQNAEILELNKAAIRFFGGKEEEIRGKNIFSYESQEDLEKTEKLVQYYKSHIPINNEEIRMIAKNGVIRWVLLSVFEINSPGNSARAGLVSIFDITEQKQLDQAKTEFVSLASHQLRTPVATINWYMDMLLSDGLGELNPKQKDYASRIYLVNKEMIGLIDVLLNVSRIEMGSVKIELKETNVAEIIESILIELASQIQEKNLTISKQYDNNQQNIESDPKLLRIVIQNLISNSVKYTPNGGTITVTFKDSVVDKAIVVSDTGVGIPENAQDKIFTKLFRADNVRSLVGSHGTGLGLYLIKSIIEAMGGEISFVSRENEGSTFTIKL